MTLTRALGPLRHFLARPKLVIMIVFGIVLYWALPDGIDGSTRVLIAWNAAIVLFLLLAAIAMRRATGESMRKRAQVLDEGHYTVLVLAMIAATASLAAIVFELLNLRNRPGEAGSLHRTLRPDDPDVVEFHPRDLH